MPLWCQRSTQIARTSQDRTCQHCTSTAQISTKALKLNGTNERTKSPSVGAGPEAALAYPPDTQRTEKTAGWQEEADRKTTGCRLCQRSSSRNSVEAGSSLPRNRLSCPENRKTGSRQSVSALDLQVLKVAHSCLVQMGRCCSRRTTPSASCSD